MSAGSRPLPSSVSPQVPDKRTRSVRGVHDALRQRRFVRDHSGSGLRYRGVLDETGLRIPVVITVTDLDFVTPPVIRLVDPEAGSKGQIPHVLRSDGTFCYLDGKAIVLDRYRPAETIIQCLEQADKVLRDAVRGRLDEDLIGEFGAYWADGTVLMDLPPTFEGDAKIQILRFDHRSERETILVSDGASRFHGLHKRNGGKDAEGILCPVLRVPALSFDPKQSWPPKNLAELNSWMKGAAPSAVGAVEEAFARSQGHRQWICLSAPNGRFFVSAEIAPAYRTPEILKNRRAHLRETLQYIQGAVKISGYVGVPVDEEYVFSRNMGAMNNLAGKRILVVGCGAVGGFLAQNLAQSGAGAGGGTLTLVDNDKLKGANLGRHLLGAPYLDRNKADGCADLLREQLPYLDITSIPRSIMNDTSLLRRQDLVIEATGEESLSIAINELAVNGRPNFPPVLFGWLQGNGAAAVAFLAGDPDLACFKCLKVELAGPPRFRIMRSDVQIETGRNLACGDAHYIPFPVSRATIAAGLICDVALDWANGGAGPKWRSITLDHHRANHVKDGSPKRIETCPACGGVRQ
ncbi:ThiF family adenylyltransferase [Bradyrhizobium sp. USDA 4509]